MKATIKDLKKWYDQATHCKTGYCCIQKDKKSKFDMVELGYNSGLYGWNWTAYLETETNTLYIECYRNVPNSIKEK